LNFCVVRGWFESFVAGSTTTRISMIFASHRAAFIFPTDGDSGWESLFVAHKWSLDHCQVRTFLDQAELVLGLNDATRSGGTLVEIIPHAK